MTIGATGSVAQTSSDGKLRRVSFAVNVPATSIAVFKEFVANRLKQLGYIDGQNLSLDIRSLLGLSTENQEAVIADVVRSKPEVIVVDGTLTATRVAKATRDIPVVMMASVDPVDAGLAQSLARPGGNVTGLATDVGAGAEGKRMELFLDMVPRAKRVAFVGREIDWTDPWGKAVQAVAARRKVNLIFAEGNPSNGYADSLAVAKREAADALFIALSPSTRQFAVAFVDFSVANRVPVAFGITEMADRGCSMAYGQSDSGFVAYSMTYVAKILNGAKPGDLPIEQPKDFKLVLNLKNAKAIGLQVPQLVLLLADRVIE